jgi:hypothetical protein
VKDARALQLPRKLLGVVRCVPGQTVRQARTSVTCGGSAPESSGSAGRGNVCA